jgi:hypothetical protein
MLAASCQHATLVLAVSLTGCPCHCPCRLKQEIKAGRPIFAKFGDQVRLQM